MRSFFEDIRYGLRTLFKHPGFTCVAVLSLALGIGAVTSVYSMVSSVLLHPLPYEDSSTIVRVSNVHLKTKDNWSVSYPQMRDWQEQNTVFEYLSGVTSTGFNLTGEKGPEFVEGGLITSEFFPLLRIQPILGRNINPEEDEIGQANVVMLAEQLWESRYDRDESLIGDAITLNGVPYTVIGIVPEDFRFLEVGPTDLWVPAAVRTFAENRGSHWLQCIGRLNEGVSFEQAEAEMNAIVRGMEEKFPDNYTDRGVGVTPYGEDSTEDLEVAFWILFGCVGFVLLIACVNVANLLLARVTGRQKEVTIRVALGAGRGRLIRQLLTESMVLALMGGALGVLFSMWGIDFIISLIPAAEAMFYVEYFEFSLNSEVLLVTLGITLLTGILFGLVPALQASNPDLNQSLKEGGAAGAGKKRHRLLGALVISEVALALILLISAGLMMQSFQNVRKVDPGFDTEKLLVVSLGLAQKEYDTTEKQSLFFNQLEERLAGLGNVKSVGGSGLIPLTNSNSTTSIWIEGQPDPEPGKYNHAGIRPITPNYPETMGFRLLEGRYMTAQDNNKNNEVTLINQAMAEKYWPNENAVGKRFRMSKEEDEETKWITVVGILGNVRFSGLTEGYYPEFFLNHEIHSWAYMNMVIRTEGDPTMLANAARLAVRDIDPNQPVYNIETMESYISESIWMNRFTTVLFGVLALMALCLSVIGVYGVINYSVSQRTHEIGIRMALGAQNTDVQGLVVRQGLKMAVIGVLIGLPCAYGLGKLMASLLYGVSSSDPMTFAGVSIILVFIAIMASFIPARKATRVDPVIALRYE
jgi:putative ABC transport system permease protein